MSHKNRRSSRHLEAENRANDLIDDLIEFREFRDSLLPVLQADVKKGTPAKEILDRLKTLAAARLGHIIMSETDSGKALSAIKDILDRTEGKAKESITTTHKFDKLDGQQLDSMILSKLNKLKEDEEDGPSEVN